VSDKTMHEAFIEAYAEIQNPKKNASNPAFKSKYANLEEMLVVSKPVLIAAGFALVQEPTSDESGVGVATRLIYRTGESLDFGAFTVPLAKRDAQGAGSAITYCRRYAIAAIFGLAQEDDDGNTASASPAPRSAPNARSASTDATTPDAGEYAALMASAKKNGTGAAVKAKLAEWKQPSPMTLEAYAKLTTDARGELESIAATK
jgi:hypothetical protein